MAEPKFRYNPVTQEPEVLGANGWEPAPPPQTAPSATAPATPTTGATAPEGSTLDTRDIGSGHHLIVTKDLFGNEVLAGQFQDPSANGGSQPRNDALTAASDMLRNYLTAQSLADARRVAAFDQFQKLSQFALPAGSTTAPGYEPGGPANAFAAQIGLKQYTPPPIQTAHVDPSVLGGAPPVDPRVMQMLNAIGSAGGAQGAQ